MEQGWLSGAAAKPNILLPYRPLYRNAQEPAALKGRRLFSCLRAVYLVQGEQAPGHLSLLILLQIRMHGQAEDAAGQIFADREISRLAPKKR